jgi:hypothetical protein
MNDTLETRLEAILRATPSLMRELRAARALALPDWLIVSGAVYQRVLNHLSGREPDHGLKDIDLFYFDDTDPSYEAEDAVVRRAAAAFPPLSAPVEVRNQARVHLWFERRFGQPYAPLGSSGEALKRFVSPLSAVGVRLEPDERMTIVAPFGLADLFALRMRQNPLRPSPDFAAVAAKAKARWPELRVDADGARF